MSFPAYDNPSSTLVKMYLNGEFGAVRCECVCHINVFAADRFATHKTDWGKGLRNGTLILADRYVVKSYTSGKQNRKSRRKRQVLTWLDDLEYNVYGLPRPNVTIFR